MAVNVPNGTLGNIVPVGTIENIPLQCSDRNTECVSGTIILPKAKSSLNVPPTTLPVSSASGQLMFLSEH